MQALTYLGPKQVEWREADEPSLEGPGEALVRPLAVSACDLDTAIVRGDSPFEPPFVLGHECIGEVISVGEDVTDVQPGQCVVVPFQISCGECDFCRRGLTANCTSVPRESMYGIGSSVGGDWGGALADVLRVPYADAMLVSVPDGVALQDVAGAMDNIADGWRAVAPHLQRRPEASVLVLGGGPGGSIGLYAVLAACALGTGPVRYYDTEPTRLETASQLGAEVEDLESWPDRLEQHGVTVDAANDPAALACAMRSTEPGGVCTSTSIYFDGELPVPITEMYMKGITFITGRVSSRARLPEVLEAIDSGRLEPRRIAPQVAPWSEAPQALLDLPTKLILLRPEAAEDDETA